MTIFRRSYDPPQPPPSPLPVAFTLQDGTPTTPDVRTTIAKRLQNFNLRAISFYTSKIESIHNVCPCSDMDIGDVTMSLFKRVNNAWISATEDEATKTVLDWDPAYDYEIIGGYTDIPRNLRDGTTDQWYISVVGVPDYPPSEGGSVRYITDVNIEAVTANTIVSDGRATSFMKHNASGLPHTNRLRFIVKHPVGAQQTFRGRELLYV